MHIADGILSAGTCAAGYAAAGGLVAAGLRKVKQADVARTGILTAGFFLASLIRFPLPGTSVHLLLASLNGIALGALCFPSIFLALVLQAVLLGHGGVSTIGVNTVMMAFPAWLMSIVFHRLLNKEKAVFAFFFLAVALVLALGLKFLVDALSLAGAGRLGLSWFSAAAVGAVSAAVISWFFRGVVRPSPLYLSGFAAGSLSVLLSAVIFVLILSYAPLAAHVRREGFVELARFAFLLHVPVMVVEGVVAAFLIKYLDTVSPELLRLQGGGEER